MQAINAVIAMSLLTRSFQYILLCVVLSFTSTSSVVAAPSTTVLQHFTPSSNYGIASGIDLRILPLGASITIGHGSSDGNAYREKLRDLMPGNRVTYFGSKNEGNMTNNECECHSGFPIGPLIEKAQPALAEGPNVILVIAGTNDLLKDMNVKGAPEVMGHMLDNLTDTLPTATVVVAKLPPFTNTFIDRKRRPFNAALDLVIQKRQEQGRRVLLVDPAVPPELINGKDHIHPNDVGYQMYADKFYLALVEAGLRGWIEPTKEQRSEMEQDLAAQKWEEDKQRKLKEEQRKREEEQRRERASFTGKLTGGLKKTKKTSAAYVKKTRMNVGFIIGLSVMAGMYLAVMKIMKSTRLRLRWGSGAGRVGLA